MQRKESGVVTLTFVQTINFFVHCFEATGRILHLPWADNASHVIFGIPILLCMHTVTSSVCLEQHDSVFMILFIILQHVSAIGHHQVGIIQNHRGM
jgi:hypothetical protein